MTSMRGPRRTRRAARRDRDRKESTLGIWTAVALLALVAGFLTVLEVSRPHVGGDRLRLDTLVDLAERGRLEDAEILNVDSYLVGNYLREDETPARYNAPYLKETQERLVTILLENRVATTVDQQTGKRLANLASVLIPALILIVLFVYLILSSRRGTGLFKVRSGARKITAESGSATFADVAGQDAAVAELREVSDFLAHPERFRSLGASVPKGLLLYGPPGCGKTLLARALAGESGASFYSISGSDFVEVFVGVGAARVRDLFQVARENAPAVIFIDELDSIGRARSTGAAVAHHSEQEQALNQILAEMDGFAPSAGIIVVAATNRPDVLDPALLRAGRFDRTVGLARPDEGARLAILTTHAKDKRLSADVDLAAIAHKAVGLTGADLASVMNEGALQAGRAGHDAVAHADLERAVDALLAAPERQRRLSMRDRSVGRRVTDKDTITFADVAGQEEAVTELREIKDYLAAPEKYQALGARIPRGVLLYGPPGCGKTLLARALAGETNAAFFSVAASELIERLVGEGAARIRDLFAEATQMAPAILFIDELDALGHSRTGVAGQRHGAHSEQEQSLDQILAELDGFTGSPGVLVLGATNRPDVLDPALLRPGRFDRSIGLALPDETARLAILTLHADGKALAPDADLAPIASRAHGLTGADLANVVNEAALLAARTGRSSIDSASLRDALQRTLRAPERQRRLSTRARSVGQRYTSEDRVTFADVAGADEAVEELRDVAAYLADPARFASVGAAPPRGVLLSGPPGCGKTLLARAVAGESNAAFLSASASEFVEIFVGEGALRVRELFAEARSMAPAIVFIDELDAMGQERANTAGGGREYEQTLNQLLVELDGFQRDAAVIVMGATNRPDLLDAALVRQGRFDRRVDFELPDRIGRLRILEVHAARKPLSDDVDLDVIAGLTRGCSGADLAGILNEAALLAARRNVDGVTMALLEESIDRVLLGVLSRRVVMSADERLLVAYHEAGHALVAQVTGSVPPAKLTILPRGSSLGRCSFAETHDRNFYSRSMLMDRMACALGGWAAERLVFGESSSGAGADLAYATGLARKMVCELGMSDSLGPLGAVVVGSPPTAPLLSHEAVAAAQALAAEAMARADEALRVHRDVLDAVAASLNDRETLSTSDLGELFAALGGLSVGESGPRVAGNGRVTVAREAAERSLFRRAGLG